MQKVITIDYQEIQSMNNTIDNLRNQLEQSKNINIQLTNDLKFLKIKGENILVIVKNLDKPDVYEYKSTEKNLLSDLVIENSKIRDRYDELSKLNSILEDNKSTILLKYKEMESYYKKNVQDLFNTIIDLESRHIWDRIINKPSNFDIRNVISYNDTILESGITKSVYTEDEMMTLIESTKKIKKERGWHFKDEYIDSEGNVYHKGKLQPHLKKIK